MIKVFKKSYKFAFKSSALLSIVLTLILGVFLYKKEVFNIGNLLLFFVLTFILAFVVIQMRVELFIYRRVKKIYDDLTLLESHKFTKDQITTDMKTLT